MDGKFVSINVHFTSSFWCLVYRCVDECTDSPCINATCVNCQPDWKFCVADARKEVPHSLVSDPLPTFAQVTVLCNNNFLLRGFSYRIFLFSGITDKYLDVDEYVVGENGSQHCQVAFGTLIVVIVEKCQNGQQFVCVVSQIF